jgi:hypothetical protein
VYHLPRPARLELWAKDEPPLASRSVRPDEYLCQSTGHSPHRVLSPVDFDPPAILRGSGHGNRAGGPDQSITGIRVMTPAFVALFDPDPALFYFGSNCGQGPDVSDLRHR